MPQDPWARFDSAFSVSEDPDGDQDGEDPWARFDSAFSTDPPESDLGQVAEVREGATAARSSTAAPREEPSASVLAGAAPDAAEMRLEEVGRATVGPTTHEELTGGPDPADRRRRLRGRFSEALARSLTPTPEFTLPGDEPQEVPESATLESRRELAEEQFPSRLEALGRAVQRGAGGFTQALGGVLQAEAADMADGPERVPLLERQRELIEEGQRKAEPVREAITDAGESLEETGSKIRKDAPISMRVERGDPFQPANPDWWLERGAETGTQFAPQLALAAATRGQSAPAQIAAFTGPVGVLEGGHAFTQTRDHLIEQGVPEEEARQRAAESAATAAAGSLALEAIPGAVILFNRVPGARRVFMEGVQKRLGGRAGRALSGAAAEGAQEAVQEAWQDVVEYAETKDPSVFEDMSERYAAAGSLGGLMGAGAGAVVTPQEGGRLEGPAMDPAETPEAPTLDVTGRLRGPEGGAPGLRRRIAETIDPTLREEREALREEAGTDPLTGFENRRGERRALEQAPEPEDAERLQLHADIDNMKAVNDRLGHEAGDEVLQVVTNALRDATREDDVVSRARTGGDEFRVTMDVPEGTSANAVRYRVENAVNEALAEAGYDEVDGTEIGFSVGTSDQDLYDRKAERGVSEGRKRREQRRREQEEQFGGQSREGEGFARSFPIPTEKLKLAPEHLQYKSEGIDEGGTSDLLENVERWKPNQAGVVAVWRWDDPPGDLEPGYYVVNGHHRVQLARRLMNDQPAARQLNVLEISAGSPTEARSKGAMINMSEGRGTRFDAAKFLRNSDYTVGDLREMGVPLTESVVSEGLALSNLSEPLWRAARRFRETAGQEGLSPMRAVTIGRSDLAGEEQIAVWGMAKDRDMTVSELERLIEAAEGSGGREADAEQTTFIEEGEETNLAQQAEVADYVLRNLKQDRTMANALTVRGRAERAGELGVAEIDTERAERVGERAELMERGFQALWTRSGPINKVIRQAADRIRGGDTPAEVKQDALREVQQRLPDVLGQRSGEGEREQGAAPGGPDAEGGAAAAEAGVPEPRGRLRGPEEEVEETSDAELEEQGQETLLDPAAQGDMFGGDAPAEGGDQFGLDLGEEQDASLSAAERQARNTIERLRPVVEDGDPSLSQLKEYREALALLNRTEAQSEEETRLEARIREREQEPGGEPPEDDEPAFFDPEDTAASDLVNFEDPLDPAVEEGAGRGDDRPQEPIGDRLTGRRETPRDPGEPISSPEVVERLSEVVEAAGRVVPIRTGRTPRGARGVFKVRPEVIRVREANNIPTAAHEVAHALEKAVFGRPKGGPWQRPLASSTMQQELVQLGRALYGDTQPAGGYKREGFAEYLRLWVTDPQAAVEGAPSFHRWFEGEFLADHPEIHEALHEARTAATRWRMQGSVQRARGDMVDEATLGARAKRLGEQAADMFGYEGMVEELQGLYELAREAEQETGEQLSPAEDPYFTASALRYTHSSRTRYMVEHGMIDLAGNRVGPPLNDVKGLVRNAPLPEDLLSESSREELFQIYLWAKRAEALWTDPEGPRNPGISLEDARQIIDELQSAHFDRAAGVVYEWADGVLDYAAEASPTFAQVVDRVRERDPGAYVPLKREFDELKSVWSGVGQGASDSPVQTLTGSGRRVKEPLQSLIANAEQTVRSAHERLVFEQVMKLSQVEGLGHLIEEVSPDQAPVVSRNVQDLIEEVNRRLMQEQGVTVGVDEEAENFDLAATTITFFSPKNRPDGGEPILPVWDGEAGQVRWFRVNEKVYDALSGLDMYRLPKVVDWVWGTTRRMFRAGTTALRASFGMLWNPIKDIQTFIVNTRSSENAGRLFTEATKAVADAALFRTTGRKSEWLDTFLRLGGEMAQPLGEDIPHTRRVTHKLFEPSVTEARLSELKTPWKVKELDPRNWYDWFRDMVQAPETAPRTAEIKQVAGEMGWEPGQPLNLEQSLRLLNAAKQVTTDFTAAGKFGKKVNQMIPFFNAAIQGPRATVRAARRNPGRVAWRLLQMGMLSLWLAHLYRDEEWYKELTDRERYMYWWFPIETPSGEQTLVRIPRAFDLGAATSVFQALYEGWHYQEPERATAWFENLWEISNPTGFDPTDPKTIANLGGVPGQVVGEQLANERFFWDAPIVPRGEQRKPAEEQYGEYTTRASRLLGDLFDVSPRRLDHIREGVLGRASSDLLNALGLGISEDEDREGEAADLPIVGRLFRRGGEMGTHPQSVNELYETLSEAQRRQASNREEESATERQLRLQLNDAVRAISTLSTVRRETDDREKRNAINQEIADIAQEALEAYYAGEVRRGRFRGLREGAERREEGGSPGRLEGRRLEGRRLQGRSLQGRKLEGRSP